MVAETSDVESTFSDEELIDRICGGDHAAFDLLYERYFPRVCGFVRRRLRNQADVEETVQEAFINVFTSLDSFRAEAPFGAWVLGVTRRTIASRFKKKQHVMVPLDESPGEDSGSQLSATNGRQPTPLDHYECAERIAQIEATAQQKLSQDQRTLIELHHVKHHSVREIALVLNRSEDSVKSNLYRARKLLLAR